MAKAKPSDSDAQVYHLAETEEGLTLAAALRAKTDQSWGQVKRWIGGRHVQVNGNLCLDEARRVTHKDVIKLFKRPLPKPVGLNELKIVHLDEHLLVVEKPAALTTVRHFHERKISTRRRQLQPTLAEMLPHTLAKHLRMRWPPLPPQGMNKGKRTSNQRAQARHSGTIQNAKKLPAALRVFPVHRLDRDTSGLMLFARTKLAEERIAAMFRRHTIHREYTAFCIGNPPPQTIESMLVRDRGDGIRGSVTVAEDQEQPDAVKAVTHILDSQPLVGGKYARLRCRLETGRTHQIRIHLSEAGFPLCGDKIYCKRIGMPAFVDNSQAPRQALHAHLLAFSHPVTGEQLSFRMELPADLRQWIARLS